MFRLSTCFCIILIFCTSATRVLSADEPTLDQMLDLSPKDKPANTEAHPHKDKAMNERGNTKEPATNPSDKKADGVDLLKQTEEQLLDYKEAADRFEQAIGQMAQVSDRLAQAHDAKIQTQRMQEQIIRKLEQTIEAAKRLKQKKSSNSSKSPRQARKSDSGTKKLQKKKSQTRQTNQSTKPNQGSPTSGSPTAATDKRKPLSELGREWGRLPPRLRNELSDGIDEPFSPVYRRMTEAYYRRLAEESGQ